MILVINICHERLHYFEFVKPIEDVLNSMKLNFKTKHYKELSESDFNRAEKVIICGTSLHDNEFIGDYHNFDWLLDFTKPVLGICGGMQLIGMVFGNKMHTQKGLLGKKTEIGFYKEDFEENFLELIGELDVYHLHNYYVKFWKEFKQYAGGKVPQAVKHKTREIYGVLFHPEVRNKELIKNFLMLGSLRGFSKQ